MQTGEFPRPKITKAPNTVDTEEQSIPPKNIDQAQEALLQPGSFR